MNEEVKTTVVAKSINDLKNVICEEIDKLRNEKTTAANVNAITNASGKVISMVKLQLEYAKLIGLKPQMDFILKLKA